MLFRSGVTCSHLLALGCSGKLFEYNPLTDVITPIPFTRPAGTYLRYLECFGDELWIGTQTGLFVYNRCSGETIELKNNPLNPFSLSNNTIYCIYRDNENGAWLGTMFGGVNYMPHRKFGFTNYGLHHGLSSQLIIGLGQDVPKALPAFPPHFPA